MRGAGCERSLQNISRSDRVRTCDSEDLSSYPVSPCRTIIDLAQCQLSKPPSVLAAERDDVRCITPSDHGE
jgi:hypothetical protein